MNDAARGITRRQFLKWGSIGCATAVGTGGLWSAHLYTGSFFDRLVVTDYTLHLPGWRDLPSLTIAFLSDLHVGSPQVTLDMLPGLVEQVNALDADIILLGGDFLTSKRKTGWREYIVPEKVIPPLGKLQARLGVHSVLGNHDWWCDGPGTWRALTAYGIHVMENSSQFIKHGKSGFHLVGLADYTTRKVDGKKAFAKTSSNHPRLLLSHDPYTYHHIDDKSLLQMSGHTHGGQIALPLVGPIFTPTPGTPLSWMYGKIEENNVPMIVTSGVGTSMLPLKNTPSEVVRIRLEGTGTAG